MVTWQVYLPTYEELECEEIKFGGPILKAGSSHLGKYCEDINDEFMMCRKELGPRYCIKEGKLVTKCTFEFFNQLKKNCYHELDSYAYCLDKSSKDLNLTPCKKTQAAFDKCVLETMNIARPDVAYYSRPRFYKGNRPEPKPIHKIFDDPLKGTKDEDFPPEQKVNNVWRVFGFRG